MSFKFAKFYTRGWGDAAVYRKLYNFLDMVKDKASLLSVIHKSVENTEIIIKEQKETNSVKGFIGEFVSPATKFLPDLLPPESVKATFQMVLPRDHDSSISKRNPVCIHLAGTGDHYFWRRRHFVASPLAKDNKIGSIILENPFYGTRKPKGQIRSSLRHVSDTFVMGAALLLEVMALLKWCEKQGFGPLGISGVSLGGYMTSVAASGWPYPLAIIPCLSWTTAAPVFTQGAMSHNIAWSVLQSQLETDHAYTKLLSDFADVLLPYRNLSQQSHKNPLALSIANENQSNNFSNEGSSQRRKLNVGPISLEFGLPAILENVPSALYNAIHARLNVDDLREATAFADQDSISNTSQETIDFMNMLMHKSTHMKEFNVPHPESKVTFVVANHDRYVPWEKVPCGPQDYWKNIEFRHIDAGHVMAILQNHDVFRRSICDTFAKLN